MCVPNYRIFRACTQSFFLCLRVCVCIVSLRVLMSRMSESVCVFVRCRASSGQSCVELDSQSVSMLSSHRYTFDSVFGFESTQENVFTALLTFVDSFLLGFNGTVFAYGQTGSGKTYTMMGSRDDPGIIPRVLAKIISISSIECSFLEIYNEEIRDLLSPMEGRRVSRLCEQPDGSVCVKNLMKKRICNLSDFDSIFSVGLKNRIVAGTLMNAHSSRSHAVFTVYGPTGAKLNLVDLAGSERQRKSGAVGDTLKEAAKINLSLSALGNVISMLSTTTQKANSHIPYRDSKLTRLLSDSLGGNTKTVLVATISPDLCNSDETLSTLRFANRTKHIQNQPVCVLSTSPVDTSLSDERVPLLELKLAESEYEKTHLLETLCELEKLNKFYESVIYTMIPADVVHRLETTCFYNEALGEWEFTQDTSPQIHEDTPIIEEDSIDEILIEDSPVERLVVTRQNRPRTASKHGGRPPLTPPARPSTSLYPIARGLVAFH